MKEEDIKKIVKVERNMWKVIILKVEADLIEILSADTKSKALLLKLLNIIKDSSNSINNYNMNFVKEEVKTTLLQGEKAILLIKYPK